MHRSYQPLKPTTNLYLQRRWDQEHYEDHRRKVSCSLPTVDDRGPETPAHLQLKLKKLQLQDERLEAVARGNRLLASGLARIVQSKGLVDHHNQYRPHSLNADRRRAELLLVGRQNLDIHRRITSRQSEYRRQLWSADWERAERLRDSIARYPRRPVSKQAGDPGVRGGAAGRGTGASVGSLAAARSCPRSSSRTVKFAAATRPNDGSGETETTQTDDDEEPPSTPSSFESDRS